MVAEECDGAFVEEVSIGQAGLDAVRPGEWAFVILDIAQPDKNGPEILHDLQALRSAILILSHHVEEQYAAGRPSDRRCRCGSI